MHKFNVKPPAHIHLKWTIFLYSKFLISLAEMLCLWFVWSSVYLNRGRQRADDSQPWDLPPYGQHPEWHGGLGEDDPKGHLGSFWWRLVYMREFSEKNVLTRWCEWDLIQRSFGWLLKCPVVVLEDGCVCLFNVWASCWFRHRLGSRLNPTKLLTACSDPTDKILPLCAETVFN